MDSIINLQDITFTYDTERPWRLVRGFLWKSSGEWWRLSAHNGSGKSTLAKTINGLLLPQSGRIQVGNMDLNEGNIWDIRKMVGMVFQNPDNQFVGSTVEDDVAFGMENQGIPREEMVVRVADALEQVRMSDFKTREPARLSGGQKQRVAIAGVPCVRILLSWMKLPVCWIRGREEVIATIKKIKEQSNLTVLSITHDIDEAANANRVLVMKEGRLIDEGTPEKIFSAGPKLVELGLDLPFPEKLKAALKERGITVPAEYLTEEGMVDWLWTSVLNK